MSAGVVAALSAEARTLGRRSRRGGIPAVLADGTLIAVSGMGLDAAAAAAHSLIAAGANSLVSWGLAGGLDPTLPAGAICLPCVVVSATGARFDTDHHWREAVRAAITSGRRVVDGSVFTSPRPIDTIAGKAAAFRATGAVAVDMESSAVAQVAAERGLPFLAVRVIVDAAGDALPPAALAASHGGQIRILRLIRGLLCSPADLLPMMRLARRYRTATRALVSVGRSGALAPVAHAVASGNRIA